MPGRKNKSYKLGLYIPKSFQDNQPSLDNSYPNFGFRDSGQHDDFPLDKDKARRKLPPIPTDMDNGRTRMTIDDKKTLVNPIIETRRNPVSNSLGLVPAETRPQGYQMTHNPIYDSSTTTLNSESSPTLVRRALSSTDESSLDQVSQNMEEMSLEIPPELANTSTQNPLYNPDISESVRSQDRPNQLTVVATMESDYFSQRTNLQSPLEENNEPFIPEPDYDEDEITIDFKSEDYDQISPTINSGNLYKDYEGEDFGQYLSDEEEHIENLSYTWRKNIHHNYPRQDHSRKAKTEAKRQRPSSQRTAQKLFKSAPKMKGSTMRQNLREFSFADAKISLGNTVSQVYNNRYKKNTDVTDEDEQFLRSRHSYEQFLRNRFSQSLDGEGQIWSQEYEKHRHIEKSFGLDFTGKLSRRFKNGKDAIVGRLTTKFRRKSDSSYQIPED